MTEVKLYQNHPRIPVNTLEIGGEPFNVSVKREQNQAGSRAASASAATIPPPIRRLVGSSLSHAIVGGSGAEP
jgi:hypothetical protein